MHMTDLTGPDVDSGIPSMQSFDEPLKGFQAFKTKTRYTHEIHLIS